ncbi:MAG TPA: LuxR C-terminal-related transcriptional regulator [Candidatus Dormibacteraeota bacterium]|nr:LuxR C-terminal-related transcriptional regulator [Candidatus Dormibacteraeota bacterium]
MQHTAAQRGHRLDRAGLEWLFRPYGLVGHRLARPAAAIFATSLVLVFLLELASPDAVLMSFGLPPLVVAMWLLPWRHAQFVGLVAAVVFIGAVFTETNFRATEVSICIVALLLAAGARWAAGEVDEMISGPSFSSLPPPAQNGEAADALRLLTRRELEIARLASGGYTSREIAALLHISERTVENHIGNVYAKLGINSRRELIKRGAGIPRP